MSLRDVFNGAKSGRPRRQTGIVAASRTEYVRLYMRQRRGSKKWHSFAGYRGRPEDAPAERPAVVHAPTPNQLILGDPPPGRSALDRRNAKSNAPF